MTPGLERNRIQRTALRVLGAVLLRAGPCCSRYGVRDDDAKLGDSCGTAVG